MKEIEYVPKPQNRFWKFCLSVSIILAVGISFLYFNRPPMSDLTAQGAALLWSFIGVPLLLIGYIFKT